MRNQGGVLLLLALMPVLLAATFSLDSSTVTYSARDAQRAWQGSAPLTSLVLEPSPGGLRVEAVLEPGSFNSGNFIRDGNARFTVFDVGEFPTATLTGTLPLAPELGAPTASGEADVAFSGTLSLHGVTREVGFPVQVTRDGAAATVTGTFSVLLSEYDMTRPNLFGVVVDDLVELKVVLTGTFLPD